MPLYEEKLICPLAVRFTQDHIRPVFQNGLDLESTIREIKTKPGTGDYDVILVTPFDAIEIIRWHKRDYTATEREGRHWFTFDNRRLYCLQRAAAALWPQRVGVVTQALYAATDGYHRKDNSTTAGREVWIGHSPKLLTDQWDWRAAVRSEQDDDDHDNGPAAVAKDGPAARSDDTSAAAAHDLVAKDDSLASVAELLDAPATPGMLELFFQGGEGDACAEKPARAPSDAPSTTDVPSSPRSAEDDPEEAGGLAESLCGRWRGGGKRGGAETYEVRMREQAGQQAAVVCVKCGGKGGGGGVPKEVELWLDEKTDLIWWGAEWGMYAQAPEARAQGGQLRWYANDGSWTPKMTWTWLADGDAGAAGEKEPQRRQTRRRGARRA